MLSDLEEVRGWCGEAMHGAIRATGARRGWRGRGILEEVGLRLKKGGIVRNYSTI
jgi:hypothetical protein